MPCLKPIALCCLLWAALAAGPSAQPAARPITLEECIQLALQHNLDLQIERLEPELARWRLYALYGVYDPVFQFGAVEDSAKFPEQVDFKKPNLDYGYELTTDAFSPGLSGRLPSGLTYGLKGSLDFLSATTRIPDNRNFLTGLRQTNEYAADWGLTLRQPLLRDLWIDAARLQISINRKNLKIAELALVQQMMNTVTKVQLAYYGLILARENVTVQEKALLLSQEVYAENRRRVEVGKLPPLSEQQAAAQVETVKSDLLAAQQARSEQENALKVLLNDSFRAMAEVALEPTDKLVAVAIPFERQQSWQQALTLRPDLRQFRLELEKSDVEARYRFNQLFPRLDAVGAYGFRTVEGGLGVAFDDLGGGSNAAYSYGVVLSFPLSNHAARKNYRASQTARQQANLRLKKVEQEILLQVENAGRLTQTAYERVNSTRQARVYAESALEVEQRRLATGLSTSFVVLQMQRNLTDARAAEVRAVADYNRAVAQLAFAEGSTLQRNGITVDFK